MSSDISSDNRISVVIPLYNHAEYIEEAVRSVLGQTVNPAEIIVVDDGSTDASAARMRALCEKYPQIIFWSQPNQGAHHALNAGIHRATGEFVSILNSDDMYSPTRFEACLNILQRYAEVSAVTTGITFIDAGGAAVPNPWYEKARSFYERTQDMSLALINNNFLVTTSNLLVRKTVFDEIGYFAPLRYTHDLDFFLRLLAWNKHIHFLDQPLLRYRLHRANTIQEDDIKVQVERAAVVAFFLYSAWSNRAHDPKDWRSYVAKITEIADRQTLGALLFHFFDHLDRSPPAAQAHGSRTRDLQFRRYLHEAAGLPAAAGSPAPEAHARAVRNDQFPTELALRDAVISDQKARIGRLEEGRQWLAGQNEQLQKELDRHAAAIADQAAWIGKLNEAKQVLAGQNEQLQKEIEKRDAIFAEQKAWIGKLEEAKQWLAGQNEQLQREIDEVKRSRLWRIRNALRSIFGPRR